MLKKWQQVEKQDRKKFHTKEQKASGSLDHYPTDSISDSFAVESKQTEKKSYSLSLDTWNKLCEETAVLEKKDGIPRLPILSLHIQNKHLVVLEFEDFDNIWESQDWA